MKKEKITLRKLQKSDDKALAKTLGESKKLCQESGGIPYPYTLNHARSFIKKAPKDWNENIEKSFAICADDNLVGIISLKKFHLRDKNAEVGYWICEKKWGKGYATEALKEITKYGFKELKLYKIFALACIENHGSIKVLEKAGYKKEAVLKKHTKWKGKKWSDMYVYSKFK